MLKCAERPKVYHPCQRKASGCQGRDCVSRPTVRGPPRRTLPGTRLGWAEETSFCRNQPQTKKPACLHPVRAVSPTGRNGLAARRPAGLAGGTGEKRGAYPKSDALSRLTSGTPCWAFLDVELLLYKVFYCVVIRSSRIIKIVSLRYDL